MITRRGSLIRIENEEYVFDTFIVGNSNRFAYTASMAVAEKPGKAYNPLFLYGKSGLGKTHLMHSIGNYIIENSNLKVLYISSDKFVNDFINAVRYNEKDNFDKIDVFKNKYIYVLISGLVFGGMHVISSASSMGDFLYIIPYSALGIAFALLYYDTDNIFTTISMHSLHNLLSIITYWVFVK